MDGLLSSGEVCEVTGIHLNNLDRWTSAWLAGRAAAGRGQGHHRRFTMIETLAIYAGARWRAEGADPNRVAGIVYFVARLQLEQLEREFEEGRWFPVPEVMLGEVKLPGGGILIDPTADDSDVTELMRRLDLRLCWQEVQERVAELRSRQPTPKKRGKHSSIQFASN